MTGIDMHVDLEEHLIAGIAFAEEMVQLVGQIIVQYLIYDQNSDGEPNRRSKGEYWAHRRDGRLKRNLTVDHLVFCQNRYAFAQGLLEDGLDLSYGIAGQDLDDAYFD